MATITAVKERINQLNQASFQILCDAFLTREGYPAIVALGTKDGTEKTTPGTPDTYFCLKGNKYVFAEYTTQKAGLFKKISDDIEKCLDEEYTGIPISEISEIVYCHTSSNIAPKDDYALKSRCKKEGVTLTLIGIDSLAEKLMQYPSIIYDHLHLSIDSGQIQNVEDFVLRYDSNALAAPLGTDFLFREKEIRDIDKAFEDVDLVILVGPAGTGKTRLAIEYAKRHASTHHEILRCIHDNGLQIYEDLKKNIEKSKEYFIFVDDADQISGIEHVVEYINKKDSGYHVRILMTVRNYAVSKLKVDISGTVHYAVIKINAFSDQEISSLMENHYDINNMFYLERIAQIAEGNARIAMLAGKIAIDENRLEAINDVSNLYAEYYGKVLHESGLDTNEKLLVSAGILAFLNAIDLDCMDTILPILQEKGVSKEDFLESLHLLHESGIADICNEKGVRFAEQCMANYVLRYVFFDKKIIGLSKMIDTCFAVYHDRTVLAVNTLCEVFRNKELQGYVEKEIRGLWEKYELERADAFPEFFRTFASVNEVQALLFVRRLIENTPAVIMEVKDINTREGKNYKCISDEIITLLGAFSDSDNIESALDLFFQYYSKRPDLYMEFYHAATSFYSVNKNSVLFGYRTQIIFFTKLVSYSQGEMNPLMTLLFIDVASHFLQFEFSPWQSSRNGKGITLYHIPISLSQGVKEYRTIIWEHLLTISSDSFYNEKVKKVLRFYGKSIRDCSREVIVFDANYICRLVELLLSPESLRDCLIVQSINRVFEEADCATSTFERFLSGKKYTLYHLIKGTKWDHDCSVNELEKKREDAICTYLFTSVNPVAAFEDIWQLFLDSELDNSWDLYLLERAVNIAIQLLADNTGNYLSCVGIVLSAEKISGIDTLQIVRVLFALLAPQEVLGILETCNPEYKNEWLYAYYHEIPEGCITKTEVEGLYAFLSDDADQVFQIMPRRDIDFLDKYLFIDGEVIIKTSRTILKKGERQKQIVASYFASQFDDRHINPGRVIGKYLGDIKLLERIYLRVVDDWKYVDYKGEMLHALLQVDHSFVNEYVKCFVKNVKRDSSGETLSGSRVLYLEDNYFDIFDSIVDEAIALPSDSILLVPRVIKQIKSSDITEGNAKFNQWIEHFINSNYSSKEKMKYMFEAIAEMSVAQLVNYIEVLLKCTDDFEVFKVIPLTPLSYSVEGSFVPLYYEWVKQLEKLLPVLSGITFIDHKNRVESEIKYLHRRIKKEEIEDILRG